MGGVPVAGVGPGAQDLLGPVQVAAFGQQPVRQGRPDLVPGRENRLALHGALR